MKLQITFKTPDAGDDEIDCLVRREIDKRLTNSNVDSASVDEEDKREMSKTLKDGIKEKLSKWIEYGEYITVEFDLEKNIATVI